MKNEEIQKEIKEMFERMGHMSWAYINRKYKMNRKESHLIMKPLSIDCWLVLKDKGFITKIIRDSVL